jgi:hypothetical protein
VAKIDSIGSGLIPFALAAGLVSGGVWRSTPPAEAPKPKPSAAAATAIDPSNGRSRALSDLHPVIELLGQSMGVQVEPDETLRAVRVLLREVGASGHLDNKQIATALSLLETLMAKSPRDADPAGREAAQLLDSYLRSDVDPAAELHKLQSKIADHFIEELNDQEALNRLTDVVKRTDGPKVDVQFLVATIPDYVDSNSAWVADEVLGAIQAGMSRANYLLDRFRLIDWSRADEIHPDAVTNDSRLHERQPGALIFRKVNPRTGTMSLQVVLLVLETPTAGVHRAALKNAMHLVHAWWRTVDKESDPHLSLVAPVFSGSMPSLAMELKNSWEGNLAAVSVVTGSAMSDANACIIKVMAPGVNYLAAVQPTSVVMNALSGALTRINPAWRSGAGVALLVEANTAFGSSARALDVSQTRTTTGLAAATACGAQSNLMSQSVYPFPLHIAQLRNDAPSASPDPVSLVPTPAVHLNVGETRPAADQLPALRPQLVSPVAEATIANTLDHMLHERISAVGIIATDARDTLFLAREVKKAIPDVQLFFPNSYLLYLHPEYIPYMRGSIVASPYPLALANQRRMGDRWSPRLNQDAQRQPFPSMTFEGIFNATLMQLQKAPALADYCHPDLNYTRPDSGPESTQDCAPPVWVSVIGDDGYWPLAYHSLNKQSAASIIPTFVGRPAAYQAAPLTTVSIVIGIVLALLIVGLLWSALRLWKDMSEENRRVLGLPLLRVLAPPVTFNAIRRLHSFGLLLTSGVLACLASWFTAVLLRQSLLASPLVEIVVPCAAWTVFAVTLLPGIALTWRSSRADTERFLVDRSAPRAGKIIWNELLKGTSILLLIAALVYFFVFLNDTICGHTGVDSSRATLAFMVSRFIGGGIVSPGPVTVCLFGALLVGMVTGIRRLSLVGNGYTSLAHESPAFRLLSGAAQPCPSGGLSADPASDDERGREMRQFASLLDMPVENLPLPYVIGTCVAVGAAYLCVPDVWTIEGVRFSYFLKFASFAVLMISLLLISQAVATWSALQPMLARLARTRLEHALGAVGNAIRWDLSIVPPRLSELLPLARRAEQLRDEMLSIANRHLRQRFDGAFPNRRAPQDTHLLSTWYATSLSVRAQDLVGVTTALNGAHQVDQLNDEIVRQKTAPLLQSRAWFALWRISDSVVDLLERVPWRRCIGTPCESLDPGTDSHSNGALARRDDTAAASAIAKWFHECEEYVALQYAFLLRDVLARIMSALFAAMLCLTLLTAAHLFYLFQSRSSLLAIDLMAVGAAAIAAIRIVVGMERDIVLSRLRVTTPGSIDFNWDFIKRVGIYGVLPLLAVVGSLFPEIGNSFFAWLEPLRKLAAF